MSVLSLTTVGELLEKKLVRKPRVRPQEEEAFKTNHSVLFLSPTQTTEPMRPQLVRGRATPSSFSFDLPNEFGQSENSGF